MVIIIIHAPLTQLLLTPFQRKVGYKINVGWLARWKKGTKMLGFISQIFIYMLFTPPFIRIIIKALSQDRPQNISTLHWTVSVSMKKVIQPKSVGQTDI